ncbi:WHIM2 domain [Sesbania bispinosa]|nr:WHIM2 domain [Sesbania bispinosa]
MASSYQADPRLLGEIHIALLRSIVKDIEDVARTPSTGLGANQNSIANSGGGHPQAYMWGFDIRNWQRHLNPLTWPEILRQFALSAGFGPKLKKQNIEQVHPCNNNEGNDGKDIISNLRSGAAVENALAIMQEKGLSNPRRSRHRLTPGTVKYAAFHVLSLEGNRGLNILEVADKIQKSGLRDLTTSKTPEASIAAALSRDTKLFERTAPSTYCVRPAYRKDPAYSEAIYSAARERIRIFKSGFADAEEADDGKRDEDSESDVAEDAEIDDLGTGSNTKEGSNSEEFNANNVMRCRRDSGVALKIPGACCEKVDKGLASVVAEGFNKHKDVSTSSEIPVCSNDVTNPILEGMDVDESIPGEPWVQGLMEGEYSDLSVEERLHALVALIGVAIEGNSIRIVLEERLEAANTLKKQMWAEAQLDKRRIKEDYFAKIQSVSYLISKNEPAVLSPSVEGKQCPLLTVDDKNDKALLSSIDQHEQANTLQENQNHLQSSQLEVNTQTQDCSTGLDNYSFQQSGYPAEKSRSNLKSYIGYLAEQIYMYRSLPLGLDRRRNRYWQFITSASQNDPGCGRIFVELHDGCWKLIDSEKSFDALLASLDVRGIRESHLHMMLQRIEMSFKESVRRNVLNGNLRMQNRDTVKKLKTEAIEMATDLDCSANIHCPASVCIDNFDESETSTSFVVQLGRNEADNKDTFLRYRDFEKWMRKECLNSSVLCGMKFGNKRCKELLAICRVKIDTDYILVSSSSSPLRMRLLKILLSVVEATLPQEALQPLWTERYRKSWSTKLEASTSFEDLLQMVKVCRVLPWVPYTTAAVALRLLELDACIFYTSKQKLESEKDKKIGIVMKLPSKYAAAKISCNAGATETSLQAKHTVEKHVDLGAGLTSYSRGQRTHQARAHSPGGRSQVKVVSSRSNSRKRSTASNSRKMEKLLGWKGKPCGRGHVRGRRSIRNRQKPAAKVDVISSERDAPKDIITEEAPGIFVREDINEGEMEATALNACSSDRSGYEDDIYQPTGDEYDYLVDNNDGYQDRVNKRVENAEQSMDPDGVDSASSDYSD